MHRRQGRDTVEPLNPPAAVQISEKPGKSGQNEAAKPTPPSIAQEPFPDPSSAASLTKKTKINPQKPGITGQKVTPKSAVSTA